MKLLNKLNGYYNYTVILTYLGMLSGFTGIALVLNEQHWGAVVCLMVAGFCDMFDGAVASTMKRTENEKRFGIQIDSLSDLICFGVLPGITVYSVCRKSRLALVIGALYALCALIRLAYFNVMEEERQTRESGSRSTYQGLPVTAAALLIPLFYLLIQVMSNAKDALMMIGLAVMAIAFVLPFNVKKPKLAGKIVLVVLGVAEFVLLMMNIGA